ncbi:FtsK/SpoIIIE domain-containing protein [Bacillus toyonensis]|uniref:FtsK/SpoIIIE domain-containing protein n=1 Tax=Bacillus toyonensis TaxID=155322 RepID=UPI00027BEA5D|nr:FtsK/SpoIIIE domain-containing protein [Bacillus toyonensis]EJV41761.1 hypothetical protein IEA_05646 [Bacillus toyonensis]
MIKEWIRKNSLKKELEYAFDKAKIYSEHKSIRIYPKIHDIKVDHKHVRYVFTLPNGVDPKLIESKIFCFKQVFGPNIDIEGGVKKFTLRIFDSNGLKPHNYNYSKYKDRLKDYKIPIVVGSDQFGNTVIYDMTASNTPHLLIAGETGSGKSSMVRVILSTLIQCMPPEKLELYLGDLKNSEFHFLRRVKHVKSVCMDEDDMHAMLNKVWTEIIERRKLMEKFEVDHIDKIGTKPYILLAIDEVAMLQGDKESLTIIEKISAVGRALGVFLMLSMQRPDAKILDGKLKLNMTVRIGFKCDSEINSRIIGTTGSEQLEKSGQLILKLDGLKKLQAPYLDLEKAKKIVESFRSPKDTNLNVQIDQEDTSNPFQVLEYEK